MLTRLLLGLLPVLFSMIQYSHWIYTYATLGFLGPLHCLWSLLSHSFLLGHPWPNCFPLTSLAHFLILHSHGFLLTLLGFPSPITLSFIFEAHGLFINFLLSYFSSSGLLRSILTFLYHIMPMSLLLLSLGSFRLIYFRPFIYFIGLWSIVLAIRV